MIRAVLDTNTLASGFLTALTPPGQILDLWHARRFDVVVSDPILKELEHTFNKPYFQARLSEEERAQALELLRANAELVSPLVEVRGVASHPGDDLIVSTALSAEVDYLVTGDESLRQKLGAIYRGVNVVSPRQFLEVLQEHREPPKEAEAGQP